MSKSKNCLIISYGPVPTEKYTKIEGGGMRCWGLAQGLYKNGHSVTVAVNNNFPIDENEREGINLLNWSEDSNFVNIINSFDVIIVNYAMGGPMSFIVDNIDDNVTLILDCYVPIYIEVSARNSENIVEEYSNYQVDLEHWNKALKRGDYFLCANTPQKHMYMGALGALGIINPYSYETNRIIVVPFGIESTALPKEINNPYRSLGIPSSDFTLLWFGALYPWFNIKPLLKSIRSLSKEYSNFKFVLVGGKNPYNNHPDFIKQYEETYNYLESEGLIGKSVFFIDWVDFNERLDWYSGANCVISINNPGSENHYSWRTRVMDYVWGELPMITNGWDPLSESLVAEDAALKINDTSEESISSLLKNLIEDGKILHRVKNNLKNQRTQYFWENVTNPLSTTISINTKPYKQEKMFKKENGINYSPKLDGKSNTITSGNIINKINKFKYTPRKIAKSIKSKGLKRTTKVAVKTILNRASKASTTRKDKQYYFISHPIDHTGAPLVLLDVMDDFSNKVGKRNINVVHPGGEKKLINLISKKGYRQDKAILGIGSRVIHGQLGVKYNDFVLLNTVAIYPNYRDYILGLLDSNKLKQAIWFIHEDNPGIRFNDKGLIARISRLVQSKKLIIYVPSRQTAEDYNKFFMTELIQPVSLKVSVPDKYIDNKTEDSFNKIKFVISGTPSDGRKGQLLAISAFYKYISEYYSKDSSKYRDFELHLIAIGDSDYISTQIKAVGSGLLDKRIFYYPKVSRNEALEITSKCNATMCSSINETFALYVAEGMLMGHILIRNNSSGYHEQIINGKNGLLVDTLNLDDFSKAIEKILNKETTSNSLLLEMSNKSKSISEEFPNNNYYDQIYID